MQEFCISIVKKIKDAFGWPGEIMMEMDIGASIGEIPNYLKMTAEADSIGEENSTDSASIKKIDADMKSSAQDIATYQVIQLFNYLYFILYLL